MKITKKFAYSFGSYGITNFLFQFCFRPFCFVMVFQQFNFNFLCCSVMNMCCSFCYSCLFIFFFSVGSVMVLWWDLSFVVIGFVIVWCVVESINQTHQTLVLCHLICHLGLTIFICFLGIKIKRIFSHLPCVSNTSSKKAHGGDHQILHD